MEILRVSNAACSWLALSRGCQQGRGPSHAMLGPNQARSSLLTRPAPGRPRSGSPDRPAACRVCGRVTDPAATRARGHIPSRVRLTFSTEMAANLPWPLSAEPLPNAEIPRRAIQGASLAGSALRSLLSSVGREPRELITRGQSPVNGPAALLAGSLLQHSAEPKPTARRHGDPWVTRGTRCLPRGTVGQSGSGSHSMGGPRTDPWGVHSYHQPKG